MSKVQYSGVRESKKDRVNDLGTTSIKAEENFKKGCLKKADRSFAQGLQCQQINSMAALMSLEDSVFISHSPQGCVGCSIMACDMYRVGQAHRGLKYIKNPRLIVTNVDQKSVVFGGEQKLREAIKLAAERYNPKLIFVYASCASGIIGDDIDAITEDENKNYPNTLIIPIHCEGFKSKVCASGFDAAFISINKYILKGEKKPKEKGLINLFAPTTISFADQTEMKRMLELIGARVNYIPFYSSLEKIKEIPSAEASTSICKVFADEFMKQLWEDYDIPYSHTVMPIGIRNTDKWYRGIAKVIGKEQEVEEIIAKEHERIEPLVAKIKDRLQGKRVFICGGTGRSFAAAALIDASAYFVLTGCTAGIIGDDIESVVQEFRDKGEEVYAIDTPGFAGDSNLGYEVVWNTFIDKVIEENVPKDDKLVNIFGIIPYHDPFWSGTLEEIDRILSKLGLKVNTFFTKHQGIETVKKASAAALNIVINPWIFKGPAEKFERKFGTPYLRINGLPVGATDTTKFVREVAEKLNLDKELVERVIEEEEDYVYSYLEQAIGGLSWKRFAVIGDANSVIGYTRYLANDYSFSPILAIISEPIFRPQDKERIIKEVTRLEYARPPKVIFAADEYKINEVIRNEEQDVTLIIGGTNDREIALETGAQFLTATFALNERLIFNRTYAGYRGSLTFTEDLYDNL